MFIELTIRNADMYENKILNIRHIEEFCNDGKEVAVTMASGEVYHIEQTYQEIMEMIARNGKFL